jgi:threonyl-tRNA synthetase
MIVIIPTSQIYLEYAQIVQKIIMDSFIDTDFDESLEKRIFDIDYEYQIIVGAHDYNNSTVSIRQKEKVINNAFPIGELASFFNH